MSSFNLCSFNISAVDEKSNHDRKHPFLRRSYPGGYYPDDSTASGRGNPLKEYLDSLRKIRYYPVRVVLPDHRRSFLRCHGRIREIERHHRKRSEEVLSILKMGPLHAYEAASRMTWDIFYVSWDQLPPWQKWFATGEANAHLRYLQELGLVGCEMQEENMVFSLANPEN